PVHASPESAVVIQHALDHVRLHAEIRHMGCDRAAQIVQRPFRHLAAEAGVQCGLCGRPATESAGSALAEQAIATDALWYCVDDRHRQRRQWQGVLSAVLRPLRWDGPGAAIEIKFAPRHAPDLAAALSAADQ